MLSPPRTLDTSGARRRPWPLAALLGLAACTGDAQEPTSDTTEPSGSASGTTSTGTADEPPTSAPDPSSSTATATTLEPTTTGTTEPIADEDTTTTGTSTGDTSTSDATSTSTTGSSTSDTTDTGTEGSTGDPVLPCDAPDLEHAPPVVMIDGLTAVPIDILDLDAGVTIDAVTKKVTASATLQFRTGGQDGHPLFDLRQTILGATLDGDPVAPAMMAFHDLGGGPGADMRVLAVDLPACSEHTLVFNYEIKTPNAPQSKGLIWEGNTTRFKWDSWSSDLWPARYLEAWFPANLIYDRFPVALEIQLFNAAFPHVVATNAVVTDLGPHHWQLAFPAHYTALSPMFVVVAEGRVERMSVAIDLVDATDLTLELWKDIDVGVTLTDFRAAVEAALNQAVATVGPYPHGDRFVAYAWNELSRSMEYAGATTTVPQYADHETFHSWWGRALRPATQNDGWIDEAWDMHSVTIGFNETPIDFFADPVVLCPENPWIRITPDAAYDVGEAVFAGIAAMVGSPALQAAMKEFYTLHADDLVTTAQLEQHLYCTLAEPGVRAVFHRFVHGNFGDPAPPPPDYCD